MHLKGLRRSASPGLANSHPLALSSLRIGQVLLAVFSVRDSLFTWLDLRPNRHKSCFKKKTKNKTKTLFLPSRTQALLTWEHSRGGWGGSQTWDRSLKFSQSQQTLIHSASQVKGVGELRGAHHIGEGAFVTQMCLVMAGSLCSEFGGLQKHHGGRGGPFTALLQPQGSGS